MIRYDEDILLAKISTVRKCVRTIRSLLDQEIELDSWIIQDVRVLNLQRAAQACLDITHHVLAANTWELPRSSRHAFEILCHEGLISPDLVKKMAGMVGFRNIAVHNYTELNPDILESIVTNHLQDFEEFLKAVTAKTLDNSQ